MKIKSVKLNLSHHGPLLASASVVVTNEDETISFLLKEIRIIKTKTGRVIVATPRRPKLTKCTDCDEDNIASSRFCGWCGKPLFGEVPDVESSTDQFTLANSNVREHDPTVVSYHNPMNNKTRAMLERAILDAYAKEPQRRA